MRDFPICGHPEWPSFMKPKPCPTRGLCPIHNYSCPVCGFGASTFPPCKCNSQQITEGVQKVVEEYGDVLDRLAKNGRVEYTRDHGEPDPSPAIPVRAVIPVKDWDNFMDWYRGRNSRDDGRMTNLYLGKKESFWDKLARWGFGTHIREAIQAFKR